MIKYIFLFLLLITSCSSNSEKEPDDQALEIKDNDAGKIQDSPQKNIQVCKMFDVVKVRECKLYYFVCEDFSIEMALVCPTVPVGVITNPPRPIIIK